MDIHYDRKADALYLRIAQGEVGRTAPLSETVTIDLDAEGKLLGIEMLSVSSRQNLAESLERSASRGMRVVVQ